MSENLTIYNAVRQVPPTALKTIQAGRLKGMSDINPMWRIRCLTEQFGPCGIGWKYEITEKRLEPGASGEISAFVDINLYFIDKETGHWSDPIPGTGGSSYVANESRGLHTSDECFKMALTDAISVACKALGMGADVYWDKDTTKYSPRPVAAPTPTQTVPNDKPINWGGFWKSCTALGYTEAQVHEVAGVDSVKGFNREQLSELMAKLKAEKTA